MHASVTLHPSREEGTPHGSDPPTVESDNDDSAASLVNSVSIDVHFDSFDDDIRIATLGKFTNKSSHLPDKTTRPAIRTRSSHPANSRRTTNSSSD